MTVSVSVGVLNTPSPQAEQEVAWSEGSHSALNDPVGHWVVLPLAVKKPGGVTEGLKEMAEWTAGAAWQGHLQGMCQMTGACQKAVD